MSGYACDYTQSLKGSVAQFFRTSATATAAAALLVLTAACGGSEETTTPGATSAVATVPVNGPSATTSTPATPSPTAQSESATTPAFDGETVTVTIADGQVRTASKRVVVPVDSKVRLVVTSDAVDEVHVHGVDEYVKLQPGKQVAHDFVARIPGTFEVELHEAGDLLFTLQVRP